VQPYSATFTDDVHLAIWTLRSRFLTAPIMAVGYSLGAVILTKYLGEAGQGLWGVQGGLLRGNPPDPAHLAPAYMHRPNTSFAISQALE
jgi:predicted alpha/beta-fold hydrolase